MALSSPTFRVIVSFRLEGASWSEVYYRSETSLGKAAQFSQDFYDAMVQFRHPATVLQHIRVADLTNPRLATVLRKTASRLPIPGITADVTSTAAIYELTSDNPFMRRRVWFRGLMDADVVRDATSGADTPSGVITNGVRALWALFQAHNMGIVGLVPISSGSYVFTPIDKITVKATGKITVTTTGIFTLTAGNRVIISRVDPKLFPGLNGHWTAQNVTGTSFDLQYSTQLAAKDYTLTAGVIRPEEYRYGAFGLTSPADFGFIGFNKHSTRGALPFSRGRKRSVRLRSR